MARSEVDLYIPRTTPESEPFWAALREGRILVQRCADCRRWTHPPLETCRWCGGAAAYEPVSGAGTVYSCTTMHYGTGEVFPDPYTVAVVELAEQPGLRMVGRLLDVNDALSAVGASVTAEIVPLADTDHRVVAFRLAATDPNESD